MLQTCDFMAHCDPPSFTTICTLFRFFNFFFRKCKTNHYFLSNLLLISNLTVKQVWFKIGPSFFGPRINSWSSLVANVTPGLPIVPLAGRELLLISYKFVKRFWRLRFYSEFANSSWNIHDMCQRVLCSRKRNFSWILQKTKISP